MAKSSAVGFGCIMLFLLPFVVIGAGVFVGMGVRPLWQSWESARWSETPCTITFATLHSSRDSDGDDTYRIEVAYAYQVQGREHRGERYSFATGSSNVGVEDMRAAVERLNRQPQQRCWVDPADPTSAVLVRDVPGMAWFGLLFGAVFGGIPLLVQVVMIRAWRRERRRAALGELEPLSESARTGPAAEPAVEPATGPQRLVSADRRGCGALFLLLFAVVWNGFSWFGFLTAGSDWFARLFLSLFLLIGAALALFTVYQLLALLNPVPELELDRGGLRPGDGAELHWSWKGDHRRMMRLEIALVGREEADYRRGTTTATDKRELSRHVIHESLDLEAEGRARLRIPADALPSLAAPNNRVKWVIVVKGEIPRFPDVNREFTLTLLPPANGPISGEGRQGEDGPIRLSGGRTAFRPGDAVSGRVHWSLAEARTRLTLKLFWYTAGKGTVDAGVVDSLAIDQPAASGEHEFTLRIPAGGPVSCSGQLVSVLWALELVAEPGGALGRVDLVVGPNGVELRPS